ncbi:MAG TPA: hypothetical protein V6D47_13970 [Oscillatoriaceae cyanobacterium]
MRKHQAEATAGPIPKQQSPAELLARRGLVFLEARAGQACA